MITRQDYLQNNKLYNDYFAQFVTNYLIHVIQHDKKLMAKLHTSKDKYFNDVHPINGITSLEGWDILAERYSGLMNKQAMLDCGQRTKGCDPSHATLVCVMKQACTMALEQKS